MSRKHILFLEVCISLISLIYFERRFVLTTFFHFYTHRVKHVSFATILVPKYLI